MPTFGTWPRNRNSRVLAIVQTLDFCQVIVHCTNMRFQIRRVQGCAEAPLQRDKNKQYFKSSAQKCTTWKELWRFIWKGTVVFQYNSLPHMHYVPMYCNFLKKVTTKPFQWTLSVILLANTVDFGYKKLLSCLLSLSANRLVPIHVQFLINNTVHVS